MKVRKGQVGGVAVLDHRRSLAFVSRYFGVWSSFPLGQMSAIPCIYIPTFFPIGSVVVRIVYFEVVQPSLRHNSNTAANHYTGDVSLFANVQQHQWPMLRFGMICEDHKSLIKKHVVNQTVTNQARYGHDPARFELWSNSKLLKVSLKPRVHTLIGVVLVATAVLLVVHLPRALLGMALGLLTVDVVQALGLNKLIDLSADESNEGLLGKAVGHRLALAPLVVFEGLESLESGSTSDELVGKTALVRG